MTPHTPAGSRAARALLGFALGVVAAVAVPASHQAAGRRSQEPRPPSPTPVADPGRSSESWNELDRLVGEQKLGQAAALAERLRDAARAAGDQTAWARALAMRARISTALHGYETAVRELREQAWPEATVSRLGLQLVYGHALVTYARAYSWEIAQREEIASSQTLEVRSWTRAQIYGEAVRAYGEAWSQREALGGQQAGSLADLVAINTYPSGVRPTLRDTLGYLFSELLGDTHGWRPDEANGLHLLDRVALLGSSERGISPDDVRVHPLLRAVTVVGDLEEWHRAAGRREAALEARLERLRLLHNALQEPCDRHAIRRDLEARLPGYRGVAWWAEGQAQLAEFLRADGSPSALIEARAAAELGRQAYPRSHGGVHCAAIVAQIEAPDFDLRAMTSDGVGRRSIEVTHANLTSLHFRAYRIDVDRRISELRDYNLLPDGDEVRLLVASQRPTVSWSVQLPPTPDFRRHRTFVTPPIGRPGLYVVVASAKAGFTGVENRRRSVTMMVGDLVLMRRHDTTGGVEIRAVSGSTGAPRQGVAVGLYRHDWHTGHRLVESRQTDVGGLVRFSESSERRGGSHFVLARDGAELALDGNLWFSAPDRPEETEACLVYTDRSVYRPHQRLLWKVVAYGGRADEARMATRASRQVTVSLLDPNHQVVESRTLTTNPHGTASGEFVIPAGRLLGAWRLETQPDGRQFIRVEEYKRPTFEATLLEPDTPIRINRNATLRGEARYYFGLPVAAATVRWHVTRTAQLPWWAEWWWGERRPAARTQTIASGTARLGSDGTFAVGFVPAADERLSDHAPEVRYRFAVSAEVTDEGGETRTASRVLTAGFSAVEARIDTEAGFFQAGARVAVTVHRAGLDGTPRPGVGTWRLVELEQPAQPVMPAERPTPNAAPNDEKTPTTPGDGLRPRWETRYSVEEYLRSWADGGELSGGEVRHGEDGSVDIRLGALAAGAYRLRYTTVDEFGAQCDAVREFVVVGANATLALPAVLVAESPTVPFGGTIRLLVHSGFEGQRLWLNLFRAGRLVERQQLVASRGLMVVELSVGEAHRGGLGMTLTMVRDHQVIELRQSVLVPWDDRELKLSFATFRDTLRPGAKETWKVVVRRPDGGPAEAGAAEVLAYMFDRSLEMFAPHHPPNVPSLYPDRRAAQETRASLGSVGGQWVGPGDLTAPPSPPEVAPDRVLTIDGYGVGGPGRRAVVGGVMALEGAADRRLAPAPASMAKGMADEKDAAALPEETTQEPEAGHSVELRQDFSETAFWTPHLLTGPDGSATIDFTVPDSVTAWSVWVHAVTRDLKGGSLEMKARSVKELMVRPYVPRFLREGDTAELSVVVNNASNRPLAPSVTLDIVNPETGVSLRSEFGIDDEAATRRLDTPPGGSATAVFGLTVPARVGRIAVKVVATADSASDGELRPLAVLPGRVHLAQSRFVTLHEGERREMRFEDMARDDDPTRINERMVVTVDGQLFYQVLAALPYLASYPYECTEQTLNRFLSTAIVSALYRDYPAVTRMAERLSQRETRLETFDGNDPNRRMALEETPWLEEARGGAEVTSDLVNVLDPRVVRAERQAALVKLRKAQTANGAFPWWPGGPPSPYMTLYILHGLARAAEFGVDVPGDMVRRGWTYLAGHVRDELRRMTAEGCCWELLTFVNYVASAYPDDSWTGDALTPGERKGILELSFRHWREHSPYLKGMLALTLARMGRQDDARLVWASVMDSARTGRDEGTHWAPEERSWLWYNDTIETHAFALFTLMELSPADARREGLVHWLLLNKKLNQWKSTRTTAEVLYALVHYLQREGALGASETVSARVGRHMKRFEFDPEGYSGRRSQLVVESGGIDPATSSSVEVEKTGRGMAFASATWHFSTEQLPTEGRGDFFAVSRRFFRRDLTQHGPVLRPLSEGATLKVGDHVEVQLSLRTRHAAEYVHLRDPRGAGFEPETAVSRFKWNLGVGWYEEVRDSGASFFFEELPAGEYTFTYRIRASMAGVFKVAPATVQSMYAPEFNAYSLGAELGISPAR